MQNGDNNFKIFFIKAGAPSGIGRPIPVIIGRVASFSKVTLAKLYVLVRGWDSIKKKKMCSCRKILGYDKDRTIYVHLMGCDESEEVKEYDNLHWFEKLFTRDPRGLLNDYC